jgi:ankyrin repeat protein
VKALKALAELHVPLDRANQRGETAAYIAASQGHLDVLKALHSLGAPLGVESEAGVKPIAIANTNGHSECSHFLASVVE